MIAVPHPGPPSFIGGTTDFVARAFFECVQADVLVAAGMAGTHGALAYLNARTRFRFTGIHPLAAESDRAGYLYDRESPASRSGDHRDLARVALAIARLEGVAPPTQDELAGTTAPAGFGAPLIGRDGLPWGMLCHFDHRLRTSPPTEHSVLRFLGARAAEWLPPSQFPG